MTRSVGILVAEDDPDDRLMIKDAFDENQVANPLAFVKDGEELMEYLQRRGSYQHLAGQPYPGIVLLDLNMPYRSGLAPSPRLRRPEAARCISSASGG